MTRAAPGPQLSVGRLRVDAAKAIAKLREYQLADRTAWVLEAIRAAVAAQATRIQLSGDANDVWLAWEGPAWAVEDLPRLFDELVSPEPTSERHQLRLLAAAVNSALGMNPAFVDVFAITPEGAVRARYTPDVLDEPTADGESALRKVAAVPANPPADVAPATGMLVHLRRRAAFGMVTYLFWEREPPEVALARRACRDITVPLHLGSTVLHRDRNPDDVMRLPLGDGLDGFVALVDPELRRSGEHSAVFEIAERGVVLATYSIALGPKEPRTPVPIRLFVDAARMPTNASRSQVRQDAHPISTAVERAPALVDKLVEQLANQLEAGDPSTRHRDLAFALLAASVVGPDWANELSVAGLTLGRLARIELVRDATGTKRRLARPWEPFVSTRTDPYSKELAPWLTGVLWAPPGDPVRRLLAGAELDTGRTRRHVRRAKRARKDQQRFFQHAPRVQTLPSAERARVRAELGATLPGSTVRERRFVEITGHVNLLPRRVGCEIVLLLEGREIERVQLESPLGFEALVDAKRLKPDERYRGVVRDRAYDDAIDAAKAGAVRAAEALARQLAGRDGQLKGFEVAARSAGDRDEATLQAAMELAFGLETALGETLANAKIWRTLGDRQLSSGELAGLEVIGIVPPGANMRPVIGRVVLVGGSRDLIARLAPKAYVVEYSGFRSREVTTSWLVQQLGRTHALEMRGNDALGAIAPTNGVSTVQLFHTGVALDTVAYTPSLLPACKIVVDSDAIVPDENWRAAVADAGLASHNYVNWEQRWIEAATRALVGSPPPELHAAATFSLDSEVGHALCHALVRGDCKALLGAELLATLRAHPVVYLLGRTTPVSIDEVCKLFPKDVPWVTRDVTPVDGFQPIVADEVTANAIGALAGRTLASDGTERVELRRRTVMRQQRLVAHRAQLAHAVEPVPGQPHAKLDLEARSLRGTGVLQLGVAGLEIRIFIEQRPYTTVLRVDGLPLVATLDLALEHADAGFDGVSELVVQQILHAIKPASRTLLLELATTRTAGFVLGGAMRTLLALMFERSLVDRSLRETLAATLTFPSVSGPSITVDTARDPHGVLSTTTWQGEWLGPESGAPVDALDRPILRVSPSRGEHHQILDGLNGSPAIDVTEQVDRLQRRRQMSRGLLPVPELTHVHLVFKRKLELLGDAGKQLGHGEIGLVDGSISTAIVHSRGQPYDRVRIDVLPPIDIAIEMPELTKVDKPAMIPDPDGSVKQQLAALFINTAPASVKTPLGPQGLGAQVQPLALRLVELVLAGGGWDQMSPEMKRNLRGAVLAWRIPEHLVTEVLLFETITGTWIPWREVIAQIAAFGNCWAVTEPTPLTPLDDARRVLLLSPGELETARTRLTIVDASNELVLDTHARTNRSRRKAEKLALYHREDVIAELELDLGRTTRGYVGVLAPVAAERRGVYPHRELHPFDIARDPCKWPTVAVIDDARFEPDRTWANVKPGPAWHEAMAAIRATSERMLAQLADAPPDALVSQRVTADVQETVSALRDEHTQVRGMVWLAGPPRRLFGPQLQIVDIQGTRRFFTPDVLGMGGMLYYHGAGGTDFTKLGELSLVMYGRLVKELVRQRTADPDLIGAHAAHALSLDRVQPGDLRDLTFDCFRPESINAAKLSAMLRGKGTCQVVDMLDDPDVAGLIEDGTETSRVIVEILGDRVRRGLPLPMPRIPPPTQQQQQQQQRAGVPVEPARPRPAPARHPIQIVVEELHARLYAAGAGDVMCAIDRVDLPLLRFDGELRIAGDNRRLHALANALTARSPWAPLAIDALAAHAATVLNAGLTQVTDATETTVIAKLLTS